LETPTVGDAGSVDGGGPWVGPVVVGFTVVGFVTGLVVFLMAGFVA
jgi:hypothetical protein